MTPICVTISDELEEDEPAPEAAAQEPSPAPEQQANAFYYDAQRKEFLLKNHRGVWLSLTETGFKRHLRCAGFSSRVEEGERLSEVDIEILRIQNHCDVDYSGPLCGEDEGFHTKGSTRVLVTQSPTLVVPVAGKFPVITSLIDGLLGGDHQHGTTQVNVFLAWMKLAQTSLRSRKIQAAQVLALSLIHI